MNVMKTLLLGIVLAASALADGVVITSYRFTESDCSPRSMLMMFRPYPGFTCVPSSTVVIAGDAAAYEVTVEFTRANGIFATEKTFVKAENGVAKWVIYEDGVKILKATAVPQTAGTSVTVVF